MVNIHLQYSIQKDILKQECIGRVLWIFTQKIFDVIWQPWLDRFKFFIVDNDEKIVDELLFNFEKCKISLTKTNSTSILILEQPVQNLTSSNCGIYQLYFYKNLFDPDEKRKIINHENLNKHTNEVIFNKIFTTDVDENEHLIDTHL